MVETISFTRRKLPHWLVADRSYFVTFRLRGTIPVNVVNDLKVQREKLKGSNDDQSQYYFNRNEFYVIEKTLDSIHNKENCYLTNKEIAPILMERFEFLEQKYCWRIPSFVVMPNHVHCLCIADKPGVSISLTKLIGEYKKYTARRINQVFDKKGRVWADENFDHWCRNADKEISVIKYIANNPVKAGLAKNITDWKWRK